MLADKLRFAAQPKRFYRLRMKQPPRVKPMRGAPSFLDVTVYCDSGILSLMDAIMKKEQK
jgi:hypothetical protein